MNEFESVILELEEAIRRRDSQRRADRLVRPLELAMRRAFRRQASLLTRKLRRVRDRFQEGFEGHVQFLNAPLSESLTPKEWLQMWIEVTQDSADDFAKPIQKAATGALEIGAKAIISDIGMELSFSLKNPRAVAYLQDYGATQVAGINQTTWEVLNGLVTNAGNEGWSYQRTAEAIIERFEEFAVGRPQEHIDSRAHLVAVTEVGNGYAEGNLIVAKDLKAAGLEMEKFWSTVGDDKVSEGCQENEDAGWIEVEQAFPSGHQRPLRFPGCRCDALYRVKQ